MTKRSRGRPRDESVDTAVVEAAVAEIAEKGLTAATMEAIAARAGVGRATLYRRWPNKSALLYFCADQLAEVIQPEDTGDLRKDLLSCLRTPGRALIRRRSAGAAGPDVHRRGRARRADANVRGGQCRESPVGCCRGSYAERGDGGSCVRVSTSISPST